MAEHWDDVVPADKNVDGDNEGGEEGSFKGVDLLEGWIITDEVVEVTGTKKTKTYTWTARSPQDCLTDMTKFIDVLTTDLLEKYKAVVPDKVKEMSIFDIENAVKMLAEYSIANEHLDVSIEDRVAWETYGAVEFKRFYKTVCNLPQVQCLAKEQPQLNLLPHDHELIFRKYKGVLQEVIWGQKYDLAKNIFRDISNSSIRELENSRVVKLLPIDDEFSLKQRFLATFSSGESYEVIISESFLFSEIYTNPDLYNDIVNEMCIAIDVALGASGCEAVVEGFYSLVTHKKNGGQSNTSLVQRSIVDWALPHPIQCPNTVRKITMLYTNGDPSRGLKKHRDMRFFDARGRASSKYNVSKVVDRLAKESSRCPHVVQEDI